MSSNPQVTIGVTAIDKASQILDAVDNKVKESAQVVENAGAQMQKSSDKSADTMAAGGDKVISKWQQMKDSAKANAKDILTSTAALGAGIVSFATSFSVLDQAQYRVDQSTLALEKSQAKLEKMQKQGTYTAEELARQQEDVAVKTSYLALQTDNLKDAHTNFLAQIPNQMLSFGIATIGIMNMMGVSFSVAGIKYALFGGTKVATDDTMIASTGALTVAMGALRVAMNFLMTHPIIFVLAGVATVIMLVATNTFGLRDAFMNLGKTVYDFLFVHFRPLADAMKWFYDHILVPLGAAIDSQTVPALENASASTEDFANVTIDADRAIAKTTDDLETYQDFLVRTEQATIKSTTENYNYLLSLNQIHDVAKLSNQQIDLAANFMREVERDTARAAQENFNLVASVNSIDAALQAFNNGSLATIADKLRELQDEAVKTSKEIDNMNKKARGGSLEDRARKAFGDIGEFVDNGGHATFVKTTKPGRSLDSGGVLYEDVFGIGMRTGTPHMLHEGELVTNLAKVRQQAPTVNVTIIDRGVGIDVAVDVDGKSKRTLKSTRQKIVTGASR